MEYKSLDELPIGSVVIEDGFMGREFLHVVEDLYGTNILSSIGFATLEENKYHMSRVSYRKVGADRFVWCYGSAGKSKCECGAHKTYGRTCGDLYHAHYCPVIKKGYF